MLNIWGAPSPFSPFYDFPSAMMLHMRPASNCSATNTYWLASRAGAFFPVSTGYSTSNCAWLLISSSHLMAQTASMLRPPCLFGPSRSFHTNACYLFQHVDTHEKSPSCAGYDTQHWIPTSALGNKFLFQHRSYPGSLWALTGSDRRRGCSNG